MAVYAEAALPFQQGYGGAAALPAPHMEGMRMSAVSRLQVCAADDIFLFCFNSILS